MCIENTNPPSPPRLPWTAERRETIGAPSGSPAERHSPGKTTLADRVRARKRVQGAVERGKGAFGVFCQAGIPSGRRVFSTAGMLFLSLLSVGLMSACTGVNRAPLPVAESVTETLAGVAKAPTSDREPVASTPDASTPDASTPDASTPDAASSLAALALAQALFERAESGVESDAIPAPVSMPPPLPLPSPSRAAKEAFDTWSVAVEDVPVGELLFALARDSGLDIDISLGEEERKKKITINAVDAPLDALLDRIARRASLRIDRLERGFSVYTDKPLLRSYPIDYVPLNLDVEIVNEAGTRVESDIGSPAGRENSSSASIVTRTEHRFWERLEESVQAMVGEPLDGETNVIVNREAGTLAVRARSAVHGEIESFLQQAIGSAKRQVLIEATIVEVDLDDRFRGGVDFNRLFSRIGIESRLIGGRLGSAPFTGIALPDLGVSIRLLEEFGEVRVLSTPVVMALNNHTAIVKIAKNRAFFTSDVDVSTTDKVVERYVRTNLHTIPVGLILLVTPTVSSSDEVILKIRPTLTREVGFVVDPNPELALAGVTSRIPEIAVREIESVLRLKSGEIAVLGGLMQDKYQDEREGVPLISRLPLVGPAFRYRDRSEIKTELLVFLRPIVVGDSNARSDDAQSDKTRSSDEGFERASLFSLGDPFAASLGGKSPSKRAGKEGRAGDLPWHRSPRHFSIDERIRFARKALRRADLPSAESAYRDISKQRPAAALAGLGVVALRAGRPDLAYRRYRRLLDIDPDHEVARLMSTVLDEERDIAERERDLRQFLRLSGSRLPSLPDTDSDADSGGLEHSGDSSRATPAQSAWLRVALGNLLARRERWEEAAFEYALARRAAPGSPDPLFNLAVAAEHRGDPAEALAFYRKALAHSWISPPAFDPQRAEARVRALAASPAMEARSP